MVRVRSALRSPPPARGAVVLMSLVGETKAMLCDPFGHDLSSRTSNTPGRNSTQRPPQLNDIIRVGRDVHQLGKTQSIDEVLGRSAIPDSTRRRSAREVCGGFVCSTKFEGRRDTARPST